MDNTQNHGYLAPTPQPQPEPSAASTSTAQQSIAGRKVIQPLSPSPVEPPSSGAPPAQPQAMPAQASSPQPAVPAVPEPVQPAASTPPVVSGSFAYDETAAAAIPAAPAAPARTYLTGSQLEEEKQPLPKGVYVLIVWSAIGFISTFLDSSSTGVLYTIGLLLSLLVTVGLLFRLEAMRKIYIALSVLVAVAGVINILGLVGLQARYHQAQKNYEAAMVKLDEAGRVSASQKKKLEDQGKQILEKTKTTDKALSYTYAIVGTEALASIGAAVYLTRPNVKAAFRTLES